VVSICRSPPAAAVRGWILCYAGPHSKVTSLGISSSTTTSDTHGYWALNFLETDPEALAESLLLMIMCSLEMFKHTFNMFHDRLSLYPQLLSNLTAHLVSFAQLKERYAPQQG
jgi:hypothetical protein